MGKLKSAADYLPPTKNLKNLLSASKTCRGCHLYRNATQTVFGEGKKGASYFFVGEQPGDKEDLLGKPFVGPAGGILRKALGEAGIPDDEIYITNAVKHFKYERSGKKRIHQKPNVIEITACNPWLVEELNQVKPKIIICLGATAARAILGKSIPVLKNRGVALKTERLEKVFITVHPSSLLRIQDSAEREEAFKKFVADLKAVLK
jgi:uracil-DNA glycosylase